MADTIDKYRTGDVLDETAEIDVSTQEGRERALVKRIDDMVEMSDQLLKNRVPKWTESMDYWRGWQWDYGRGGETERYKGGRAIHRRRRKKRGKEWSESVVNEIFPRIEQKTALLTQNNPKGVFLPEEKTDTVFAKDLEQLTLQRTKQIKIRSKLIRGVRDAELFGHQAAYVFWDDSMSAYAKGNTNVKWIGPRELIMDPDLQTEEVMDGDFVGFQRQITLEYAQWRWPKHAEKLKDITTNERGDTQQAFRDEGTLDEELGYASNTVTSDSTQRTKPMLSVVSLWYKDYTEVTEEMPASVEQLLEDGTVIQNNIGQHVYASDPALPWSELNSPTVSVDRPAYPDGRFTIKVNNLVLEDKPWEGFWPIAIGLNVPLPGRWYGMNDVEQLIGRQDAQNQLLSHMDDHAELHLHPRGIGEQGAVVDTKKIFDAPKSIVWLKKGRMGAFEWQAPPPISGDVFNFYEINQRTFDTASGLGGVNLGVSSRGKQTATEIQTLERAGQGRIGMAAALLDEFIARLYFLIAQNIQKNYDVGRTVEILGDGTEQRAITISERHKTVRFDVQIEAGSTLPFDKDKVKEDAIQLNDALGGVYLPELLEAFEVKNTEEILQRHQQWMMLQQYGELLMNPQIQQMLAQAQGEIEAQGQQQPPGGV